MAQFQTRDISIEELTDVLDSLNNSGCGRLSVDCDSMLNNEFITKNIISMDDYFFSDDEMEVH
jgi:hypothetical protein